MVHELQCVLAPFLAAGNRAAAIAARSIRRPAQQDGLQRKPAELLCKLSRELLHPGEVPGAALVCNVLLRLL